MTDIITTWLPQMQYGEALITDKQAVKIAPIFGFNYEIVANCLVSAPLSEGIDAYNSVTINYLNEKLGENWKKKFDFKIDSLFREERVDTIRKTMLSLDRVRLIDIYLDSISNGKEHVFIWVLPQNKKDANVRVCRKMPDSSIRVYSYYQVDPYSLQISGIQY